MARLSWGEQHDLAWRLPPKARRLALALPNTGLAYAPYASFLRDLDDRLLAGRAGTERIARSVAAAIAGVMPPDELRDLRAQLHGTFEALFAAG